MTLIWLRIALICYTVGLVYALVALNRTSEILSKVALQAAYLGMVLHFVSLAEAVAQAGQLTLASVHNSESLLAFLIMVGFKAVVLRLCTVSRRAWQSWTTEKPKAGRPRLGTSSRNHLGSKTFGSYIFPKKAAQSTMLRIHSSLILLDLTLASISR